MISYRQNYAALRHVPPTKPTRKVRKPSTPSPRRPGIRGGTGTSVPCPELLVVIEQALIRHGISPSRFGRNAANDPKLVFGLREKVRATPEMVAKLLRFVSTLDQREARHG